MINSSDVVGIIRMLNEISSLIRSDVRIEEKFKLALEKVTNTMDCNSASIFLADTKTGRLEEVATVGKLVDLIETVNFDMGSGLSAWVAKKRRSVLLPNLRKSPRKHFRSFVSTPLTSEDKLIGVMNLGHEEPNAFTEENLRLLEIIADQFALVIERTNFEKKLIKKNEALISAQKEIEKQHNQIIEMEKFQVLAQIAASVNHEINNPLTTIIGNIELMLMANPDMEEKDRKTLNTVLNESKRIGEITRKLRNVKRVVTETYLDNTGEMMIDIDSSTLPE